MNVGDISPYALCSIALVTGLLLSLVGQKFLRTIISLTCGVIFAVFAHQILDTHSTQTKFPEWVDFVVILVGATIISVITYQWIAIKSAIGIFYAAGFAFMFYGGLGLIIEEAGTQPVSIPVKIAVSCVGGLIGLVVGIKLGDSTMRIVSAVLGSFMAISSLGFFVDEIFKYKNSTHRTCFNLMDLIMEREALLKRRQFHKVVNQTAFKNPVFIGMLVAWGLLMIISVVIQSRTQSLVLTVLFI